MINIDNIKDSIKEIQLYLNGIAKCDPEVPQVLSTGIYDDKTKNAIIAFQRRHDIPMSGTVDFTTWEALVTEYHLCNNKNTPPHRISIFPEGDFNLKLGDKSELVYIVQILLNNMGKQYKSYQINITGIYDEETERMIKKFQQSSKLEVTGILDKKTWNSLAHIHNTCKYYNII